MEYQCQRAIRTGEVEARVDRLCELWQVRFATTL